MFRGELDLALRLDEDFLLLSGQRNDSAGLVLGHYFSGRDLMLAGRFVSARSHLEQALLLYDPTSHRPLVHQAGLHPHVNSLGVLGNVLFCLGFPEQAMARGSAAIAEARRLGHPPSLATSLTLGSRLLSLVGDNAALEERPDEVIAIATDQGFPHWRAEGAIYRGWVKVMLWRRGYRSCGAVRALSAPPGRRRGCPSISPFWPRRVRLRAKLKRPCSCSTKRCRSSKGRESVGSLRS